MNAILKVNLLTTAMLLVTACGDLDIMGNKGKFYYSNPTEKTISFKVDGKEYRVEPNQFGSVALASGEHTLEDALGHVTTFMVFEHNSGGILNPNHGVYYTFSEVYTDQHDYKGYQPTQYDVTIYGHELTLPIKSSNATVIDGNLFRCTYPIGKALPGAVNKQYKQEDIKSKCFDQSELIEYFANVHDQNLVPNTPQNEENNSISQHLSYQVPEVTFSDPQVQAVANEIAALTETLKHADKVDIHQDLNKQYHQLTVQLVETFTQSPSSQIAAEYIKLNKFIKQINQIRNYGVWVR